MNILKWCGAIFLAMLAGACAFTGDNFFSQNMSPDAASIKSYWHRESVSTWEGFAPVAVDNKYISYGMFDDPDTAIIKLEPGHREIIARAHFKRGFGTNSCESVVPMVVELSPSTVYEFNGDVAGVTVEIWIENASTKEKVSKVFKVACGEGGHKSPPPQMIFIPSAHGSILAVPLPN
ncbi:MAG: hypothetical protein ACYC9J_12605 [Sulfuricaulis sp.]